jgi:prepilin-type N-terminal cleavage/methylation domain-containing protein/prepilin-type processing-associated H-X9-DG protein
VEIVSAIQPRLPGKPGRSGFTLIELLVVIAIIGVLAALLLPTLIRTKRRAQAAYCMNNVKQLNLALLLYAGDNNDWFPANDFRGAAWAESMDPGFLGANVEPGIDIGWTNIAFLLDPQYARLGPYTKQASLYKCPGDYKNPWIDPAGRAFPVVRSYSINSVVSSKFGQFAAVDPHYALATGESYTGSTTNWLTYGRLSDITAPSPSDLFTFIDESEYSIVSSDFIVSMNPHPTGWWFFWPSTRHNFSGTLAFADGHGEIHKWVDGRTGKPPLSAWSADQRTRAEPKLVSQTPDNPDILWLQQHTTAPAP